MTEPVESAAVHDADKPSETKSGLTSAPQAPGTSEPARRFGWGLDDALIMPLVAIGLVVKTVVRWTWSLLVHLIDYIFPILLQVVRFVLFTFRILGDGVAALLRFVIKYLPLPSMRRQKWREAIARAWSWLRRKVSYKAFEEFVHHLFEDGMAWVFRICRGLSPGRALLVIVASLVWMPVSFFAATAAHAYLIAEAHSLPSWMQVFHAVAAILAKSKLLMLPAYPAAWPQAKKHSIVQAGLRACRYVANLHLVQKTQYRFGRTETAADRAADAAAASLGLGRLWHGVRTASNHAATRVGDGWRSMVRRLAKVPVLGSVLRTYAAHYDRAGAEPSPRLSERIKAFFKRWEIKFSPAYYEAKK